MAADAVRPAVRSDFSGYAGVSRGDAAAVSFHMAARGGVSGGRWNGDGVLARAHAAVVCAAASTDSCDDGGAMVGSVCTGQGTLHFERVFDGWSGSGADSLFSVG